MITIAVCDDDRYICNHVALLIQTHMKKCGYSAEEFSVFSYTSPTELLDQKAPDILFLDISFTPDAPSDRTGIDVARQLRKRAPLMQLLFLTSIKECAVDGYELGAIRYLLKNQLENKLPTYLEFAISRMQTQTPFYRLQAKKEWYQIPVNNIWYLHREGRGSQLIYINDAGNPSSLTIYRSLTDLSNDFERYFFIRPEKSYLINPAHIDDIIKGRIILEKLPTENEPLTVYFSPRETAQLKDLLLLYRRRQIKWII